MPLDIEAMSREIAARVRKLGNPAGNAWLQSYVGSPYPVLGLSVPQERAIVRSLAREHPSLSSQEANGLAEALWSGPTTEEKVLAIMVLSRYAKVLDDQSWRLANGWVDEAIGWGLSDSLASGPIATMVRRRPDRFREVLEWTRSSHIWRRRASAYAMRDLVYARELDRPFRVLKALLRDPEFWVQRGVGTWLRECWKRDRARTEAFLRTEVRRRAVPRIVLTVATERAPKAFRAGLRRLNPSAPAKPGRTRRTRKHRRA